MSGIDAIAAELKAKGAEFTKEPTTVRPGVRIAFLRALWTHLERAETWEILAELKPSLNDRCTGVAIRKLVDTAVTLDRYRREEKQRQGHPAGLLRLL